MWEKMMKAMSSEETMMCDKMCEMMGMGGEGCCVVYGSTCVLFFLCSLHPLLSSPLLVPLFLY
jgi:hypothetical protein